MPGIKIRSEKKDCTKRVKGYHKIKKCNKDIKEVILKEYNKQVIKIRKDKWEDLYRLENERYKVEQDNDSTGSAWIIDKENYHNNVYISTHFFYKASGEVYDKILRRCGFNIEVER